MPSGAFGAWKPLLTLPHFDRRAGFPSIEPSLSIPAIMPGTPATAVPATVGYFAFALGFPV
jgi:hypothetical protein